MKNAEDKKYLQECFKLAQKGAGYVSPNPLVGCVIVKDGKIIGRGYHKQFGKAHAEVNAFKRAKNNVKGATLYVNLEPCSYFGKTPPCTEVIISKGIKRVVVGTRDPNTLVNGAGIRKLRTAGIQVVEGILEPEAKQLNEFFHKYITQKLPFVTLKMAQTLDGKIADYQGNSRWISNLETRKKVHELRAKYDAILVGANTVHKDDPELTVRLVKGRNPIRVVLDGSLSVSKKSKIFLTATENPTLLFTSKKGYLKNLKKASFLKNMGVKIFVIKSKSTIISLKTVLNILAKNSIASILVEGGSEVVAQFIKNRFADKIIYTIAPKILGKGTPAISDKIRFPITNPFELQDVTFQQCGTDIMIEGYIKNREK
ncbi:MAG: bifunctional diaminohydroxyphosphoribosylaminopyrimidine deaminase/5-amino-6-(5-phosphoribosylamino)uracil reductase RibD [Bacteroidota bacterium]|nr:bifunctional diaminohydroxyphosphoribosylaminopyrimidine deaminase/5-amino-6-(5-phosphoribosylamino)uracil reductase RibD [Bacteroidota bacterium]